jgi:hypothetical protein
MNKRFVRAALMACLLGASATVALTAPLSSAYAAPSGPTVSTPVGKLLEPASKLMQTNDFAGALVLIKQAQALPDQTAFDTYKINEFLGNCYVRLNDHVSADVAFEAMVDGGAMPDEDKASNLRVAALLATEQKHFDKGVKYALAFNALGGAPDPLVLSSLAEAYFYLNDFPNASATAQKVVAATPAGQAPPRGALEVLFGAQLKANDQPGAIATLEQIVTYYDDPDDWSQIIDISLGTHGIKDIEALHIYRLRLATKAVGHADDYTVAAALALSISYPVEAQAFLDAGIAANVITPSGKVGQQLADVRSRAAKDRSTIASFDAIARKSASGEFDLKLAETYIGYGRYAEAEEAARRALTKGGAKADPNEANMALGEALLLQGKTADAAAAFNALKNPTPGMARAQHIWLLYANRKVGAAAPAAAPPPAAH